jgi:hypothetical protein
MRPLAVSALLVAALFVSAGTREPRFVVFTTAQTAVAFEHVPDLGDPYWRPAADEVNLVRRGLAPYLRRQSDPRARPIAAGLGEYTLQIAGVDGPDGKPLLVVNGFCDFIHPVDWRTTWVRYQDGGACFFQAYWERETRHFRGYAINADA